MPQQKFISRSLSSGFIHILMADVGLVPYSCNAIVVVGDEDNEAGAYQIGQQHARKVACNVRHVVIQTAVLQKILFR
jgi:hypothetical protein